MSRLRVRHSLYTLFRDSPTGQVLYHLSGRRIFRPRIELESYVVDPKYYDFGEKNSADSDPDASPNNDASSGSFSACHRLENEEVREALELDGITESAQDPQTPSQRTLSSGDAAAVKAAGTAKFDSIWDDKIYVDWDGPDDPDNPKNWPFLKKTIYTFVLALCTTSLYMGASIISPATPKLMMQFHTTETKTQLGIALYIWGFGISALVFGPMSETPLFRGRNPIYVTVQFIYCCMQIPLGFANHVAPYAVLRLISGCTASPPLCNGAASLSDVWAFPYNLYALICWSMGAVAGPYLGPLIGAALSNHNTWRWVFRFNIMMSGGMLATMLIAFPETSEQELLTRKARSLRRITGNPRIASRGERLQHQTSLLSVLKYVAWYPIEIMFREPVLLLINLHLGFVYSIIFIYLEAFPLALGGVFHFNSVEQGLSFLAMLVGVLIDVAGYLVYLYFRLYKPIKRGKPLSPEKVFASAAIFGATIFPIGLLIFGWTSTPGHWEPPVILNVFVSMGIWLMFQTYMSYIAALYPTRIASAIASNTLVRCLMSGAFPLFSTIMYKHTAIRKFPVGWGCSILGFSAIIMILLPVYLRIFGKKLRMKTLQKYGALRK